MGSISDPLWPLLYLSARRDESVVDDYHGILVSNPYRWLENPKSDETKAFMEVQLALTDSVLAECREPLWQTIAGQGFNAVSYFWAEAEKMNEGLSSGKVENGDKRRVYLKEDLPERFHYAESDRIPTIVKILE